MFLNLNLDVRVRNAYLDHRMRGRVGTAGDGDGFKILILFALFAEIKVGTDCALVTDAADTEFVALACGAITVDVRMHQVVTGHKTFECRR